jgi:hypothetical protein
VTLLGPWVLTACGLLIFQPPASKDSDSGGWDSAGTGLTDQNPTPQDDTGPSGGYRLSPGENRPRIATGETATCLIDALGDIVCWGDDTDGLVSDVPAGPWLQLAMGDTHACSLGESGEVACWGSNEFGEGQPPGGSFATIAAAGPISCAHGLSGALHCWGDPSWQEAPAELLLRGLSGGSDLLCGLDLIGRPYCWTAKKTVHRTEVALSIDPGKEFACRVDTDELTQCFAIGSLSDNQGQTIGEPTEPAAAVTAGVLHACALLTTGQATCWGSDEHGQSTVPDGTWTDLSAGSFHTCALDVDANPTCWGIDDGSNLDHGQVHDTP